MTTLVKMSLRRRKARLLDLESRMVKTAMVVITSSVTLRMVALVASCLHVTGVLGIEGVAMFEEEALVKARMNTKKTRMLT